MWGCRAEKDFRFALMRHWSLYDSMLHSTHVAIRMQTWADKGRRKLDELLTKMGFKVKECQLDFCKATSSPPSFPKHTLGSSQTTQELKPSTPCLL